MKELILLRGLPGSGKSTLAKILAGDFIPVVSVDDFFTTNGKYHFIHTQNHLAYADCEKRTENFMKQKREMIILDNTFTMDWEIAPYFSLAKKYDYRIHVVTVEKFHQGKNVHEVSDEQIRKMAEKYKVKLC